MATIGSTTNNSNSLQALTAASTSTSSDTSATKTANDAQDRFLKLLVTQLQNQDPLNPLDNSQVTSQLAQLSTVTGIDKLNTTVAGLQASYQTSQALQSASLIGHGVLVPGNDFNLSASKAVFGVDVSQASDSVKVSIVDANNKVVHSVDLGAQPPGTIPLGWDGVDDNGRTLPDGKYKITVTASSAGQEVKGAATALSYGQVNSVSSNPQGVRLNVQGLGAIDLSTVRQIL